MLAMTFQMFSSVFILDVAYVSRICCKYFIWMLHMLAMTIQVFSDVLQVFQIYVPSVSSGCCTNRSGVAYVSAVLG
jgi:hypothetical protein